MVVLSTMVGAVLLSRAVNDEQMSKRFLKAAAESLLAESSADMPDKERANDDVSGRSAQRNCFNR